MKIEYQHNTTKQKAIEILKNFGNEILKKYKNEIQEAEVKWNSDKADIYIKAMGFKVKGILDISENTVISEINLPLALKPFKNQVKEIVVNTLKDLFENEV